MEVSISLLANLRAAQISLDRFGGAMQAGDATWVSRQGLAYVYFKRQAGEAMLSVADRLDAVVQALHDEGIQDVIVTEETLRAYQQRLRSQGFSADEIQAAHAIGLTDEELAALLQQRLAFDPAEGAGSLMDAAGETASALRTIGSLWRSLPPVSLPSEAQPGP